MSGCVALAPTSIYKDMTMSVNTSMQRSLRDTNFTNVLPKSYEHQPKMCQRKQIHKDPVELQHPNVPHHLTQQQTDITVIDKPKNKTNI